MKSRVILLSGVFLFSLGIISCKQKKSHPEKTDLDQYSETTDTSVIIKQIDTLSFALYENEEKYHINNDTTMPACLFSIDMVYPDNYPNNAKLKQIQKYFVKTIFGEEYQNFAPKLAAEKYMQNYIDTYKKDMSQYSHSKKDIGAWMNYELSMGSRSLYNNHDIWSYELSTYMFTGGAHGIYTTIYQTFDLQKGKSLLLNDLINEKDRTHVDEMLRKQLANDLNLKSVNELSLKDYSPENIVATDNFYVGENGITWLYNPYDIAPYYLGQTRITLPYSALSSYLMPECPVKRIFNSEEE